MKRSLLILAAVAAYGLAIAAPTTPITSGDTVLLARGHKPKAIDTPDVQVAKGHKPKAIDLPDIQIARGHKPKHGPDVDTTAA